MKNFRKVAAVLLIVAFVCALAFTVVACNNVGDNTEKTVTVVIGEGEGQVVYADYKTTSNSLATLLQELSQLKENAITFSGTWSATGLFVTQIGTLQQGEFYSPWIAVLTSDTAFQVAVEDNYTVKRTYNNVELKSTSVGVSSVALSNGSIYMFVLVD